MREITQQGITALKSGDRAAAFRLLANAVRLDPNDVQAWLWLSGAVDSDAARIDCMRQVLRIEPGNTAAAQGLAKLLEKQSGSKAADRPEAANSVPAGPAPASVETQQASEALASKPAEVKAPVETPSFTEPPAAATPSAPAAFGPVSPPQRITKTDLEIDSMRAVYEQPAVQDQPVEQDRPAAAEQPAVENLPAEPSENADVENIAALAPGTPFYRPMHRPEVTYANYEERVIFRIRPSQVPALISFWIFFFGAYFVGTQFTDQDFMFGVFLGVGLGIVLELVIIYVIITNFRTRYTLTNQELRMHLVESGIGLPYARDLVISLTDIYSAECRQSFLQQVMGIGDLHFDAAIEGQLGHLRLRGIPHCDQRVQQMMYLVREHQQPSNVFAREVS